MTLPLDTFLEAALDRAPHAPAKTLVAQAQAAGLECTPVQARTARLVWKGKRSGAGTPGEDTMPDEMAPTVEDVKSRLADAIRTRDARGAEQWTRTWKAMTGLAPEPDAADAELEWGRLTDAEASMFMALCRKACGVELDAADLWHVAVCGALPAGPQAVHPAHLPLPADARPATLKAVEAVK